MIKSVRYTVALYV